MGVLFSTDVQATTKGKEELRMVKLRLGNQLTYQEHRQVKHTFDRLQDAGLLPYWQFQMLIVGPQVPTLITTRLYEIFASQNVSQVIHELDDRERPQTEIECGMNFEDLMVFYSAFKNRAEVDQVVYWIIKWKISRQQFIQVRKGLITSNVPEEDPDMLTSQELIRFVKKTCGFQNSDCDALSKILQKNEVILSNDQPVDGEIFRNQFTNLKDLDSFSWLFSLFNGYELKHLNFESTPSANREDRRLTMASVERQQQNIRSSTTLEPEEITLIQEFYDREIRSRNAKYVHAIFSKLFRAVKNETLRVKYLINSATSRSDKFDYLCSLAQVIYRDQDDEEYKIKWIFDIFTDSQHRMKKSTLKDFCDIFRIPIEDFKMDLPTCSEFMGIIEEYDISWAEFDCCKPILTAMTCIAPETDKQEKDAILAAVNDNPNIESYILDNFTSEIEQFFIVEAKFWNQWQNNVGFQEEGNAFGLRQEHKDEIENRTLLDPKHNFRLKEHCQYLSDYVILPKFVFMPLSKWYGCDHEIKRHIIQYRAILRLSSRGISSIGGLPALQKTDSLRSSYSKNFKMSGQKFNSKRPDAIDDDYITVRGDTCWELEISPKVIYLGKVLSNGELEHIKLVQQNKVDFQHLKRVLRKEELPFEEMQFSRKTTFEQLLNHVAKQEKKNPKKGRLIVEGVKLSGAKLLQNFEDYRLSTGTLIHVEFINESNEWPSDKAPASKISQSVNSRGPQGQQRKSAGLANLGNTCYMNSAVQVIANISQIYEYFVQTQQYKDQINTKAAMGNRGLLAVGFGNLMNQLWSGQSESLRPYAFKNILGKCNEQYSQFEQQDSQEYLSYMIDSLHEELNLRLVKPYIANPESEGRQTQSLALENWSNTLRRDWSLIFFLFYGQMRSTLVCKQCHFDSTTFDIFSNVPVPLPEPTQQTISIILNRIPNKIKDILNGKIKKEADGSYTLPQFGSGEQDFQSTFNRQISSARNTGLMRSKSIQQQIAHQSQFTEQYNYLSNDQPMRVHIKVEAEIPISKIIFKINQLKETSLDSTQIKTAAVIFTTNIRTKAVKTIFTEFEKLSELDMINSEFHCQEVLTPIGREMLGKFYQNNPQFLKQQPSALLRTLGLSGKQTDGENGPNESESSKILPVIGNKKGANDQESSDLSNRNKGRGLEVQLVCYHRRFVDKDNQFLSSHMPQLLSMPFIVNVAQAPSGRQLYDEVWTIAGNLLKSNSKFQKPSRRWWERKDWIKDIKPSQIFKPFLLKSVSFNGLGCSKCSWTKGCSGCIIEPSDVRVFLGVSGHYAVVIEWHPETLTEHYNPMASEVVEHSSVKQELDDASFVNYTSLDDCLQKFHKSEILENEMRCTKCNDLTPHIKKLEIFRPPPVMIITLKRFRQVGNHWRKVQTSVDFPVKNLDISSFVTDLDFLNSQQIETKYNLHGLVNHYGTLSYGHYTSFVVNQFDKKWYQYDDNKCTQIDESHLSKESAYILFYVRKDIQSSSVASLFPKIDAQQMFPGRPISTKESRYGYVVSANSDSVQVQYTKDPKRDTKSLKLSELASDADSSIIKLSSEDSRHLDKHMVLVNQTVQKQNQSQDNDSAKTNCCFNLFPALESKSEEEQQTNHNVRRFDEKQSLRKLDKVDSSVKQQLPDHSKTQKEQKSRGSSLNQKEEPKRHNTKIMSNQKIQLSRQSSASIDLDHDGTDQDIFQETALVFQATTIEQDEKPQIKFKDGSKHMS